MITDAPPVCLRCSDCPDTAKVLEQHPDEDSRGDIRTKHPRTIVSKEVNRISLETPFRFADKVIKTDPLKQNISTVPPWMSLLPSNRNSHVKPPKHSALHRRLTYPYFETTRYSTPFTTPPQWPTTGDVSGTPLQIPSVLELTGNNVHDANIRRRDTSAQSAKDTSFITDRSHTVAASHINSKFDSTKLRDISITSTQEPQAVLPRKEKAKCTVSTKHTILPTQEITPAKPPFFRELSGFFALRSGKWILPSRVNESRTILQRKKSLCARCNTDIVVTSLGKGKLCSKCEESPSMPGAWK